MKDYLGIKLYNYNCLRSDTANAGANLGTTVTPVVNVNQAIVLPTVDSAEAGSYPDPISESSRIPVNEEIYNPR